MSHYQNIIQRLQQYCLLVVFFLLPFPNSLLRYAILTWGILWLLEGRWLHRPMTPKENSLLIPILCFGAWYSIKLISGLWATDTAAWLDYLETNASVPAIVLLGLWGLHTNYNRQHLQLALIAGCLVVSVLYPCMLFYQYHHVLPTLPADSSPWMDIHWYLENISHIKHRLFLCLTEIFGILSVVSLRNYWQQHMGKKCAYAAMSCAILCMLITIVSTGARLPLLLIPILFAILLCHTLSHKQILRWGLGAIFAVILLGAIGYSFHPRKDEVKWQDIVHFRQPDIAHHDARLNIWAFCIETPKDYLAYGLGAGQTTNYIRGKYQQAGWQWYLDLGLFNTCHCQYLTELMENGVGGLIYFLLCWFCLLYYARGPERLSTILFCTIFAISMLTDDVMTVLAGLSLWSTGLIVLLLLSREKGEDAHS